MTEWRKYEEAAAELFRSLGCQAEVQARVDGVRATHNVGVFVQFQKFGLTTTWVVECKHWKSRVSKEKVAALRSIVDDIGADRGIIISKVGFQAGALQLANKSNITLTDLEELGRITDEELVQGTSGARRRARHQPPGQALCVDPALQTRI